MDQSLKEIIREFSARLPERNVYEIISDLAPLERELNFTVTTYYLIFLSERDDSCPILLENIRFVIESDYYVCLLCRNGVIHILDRRTEKHEVMLPEDDNPSFRERFLEMCRNLF